MSYWIELATFMRNAGGTDCVNFQSMSNKQWTSPTWRYTNLGFYVSSWKVIYFFGYHMYLRKLNTWFSIPNAYPPVDPIQCRIPMLRSGHLRFETYFHALVIGVSVPSYSQTIQTSLSRVDPWTFKQQVGLCWFCTAIHIWATLRRLGSLNRVFSIPRHPKCS